MLPKLIRDVALKANLETVFTNLIDSRLPSDVRRILEIHQIVSTRKIAPGFSGSVVYRCDRSLRGSLDDGGQFALKAWPASTERSRIEEIHRVQSRALAAGCAAVPRIHGLVTVDVRHWELSSWMPGEPAAADAEPDFVRRGAFEIGRFQRAVALLGQLLQPAPAVLARLDRAAEVDRLLPPTLAAMNAGLINFPPPLASAMREARQCLNEQWPMARARIARTLADYRDLPVPNQYVLRDVHREHVLFCDREVSGLIDFDAVRIDTPMTDLARWVAGFLTGDRDRDDSIWEAAMAGLAMENVLQSRNPMAFGQPQMIELATAIHFATTWISLANWLIWLISERRSFPAGHNRVAQRIEELTRLASREQMER